MELEFYYHRHADLLVNHDNIFSSDYNELINVLIGVTDEDLKQKFITEKTIKISTKSLASTINSILKKRLEDKKWLSEVGLFKEPPYSKKNKSRWRLDFAKNNISVEVAFNHQEATAHNILKPVLASELNHVKKEVQTKLGIVIVATKEMKKIGNFDGAVGTYESFKEYFKPYNNIITTPIVLIGIKAPKSFKIDKSTKKIITK
jgi:hypothetical protein